MNQEWPIFPLGSICTIERGGSPRPIEAFITDDPDGINWIKIGDAENTMYITHTAQRIKPEGMKKSRYVQPGDFLLSNSMSFGRPYILKIDGCIHDGWLVLRDEKNTFDKRFLYYLLSAPSTYRRFQSMAVGGVVNNLNSEMVRNLTVPVPPRGIQEEIANRIGIIDSLISAQSEQLQLIDQLVKSRFIEMFGDLKANTKGWPVALFTDFAEIDGNMTTDYEKYANYPHIGIDSIEKGTGALKGYRTVKEDGVISGKYIFTSKHIIYSKIRPNLNKVALPTFEGLCSADAYPILPNSKNCNRVFLAFAMRSEYFLEYILQFSSRTNLPKVNRKEITGFRMPLPPLELQRSFAAFVAQTDKSKFSLKNGGKEADFAVKCIWESLCRGTLT